MQGNIQLVGMGFEANQPVISVMMPKPRMTIDEAVEHAAWILALADPLQRKFPAVFQEVCNS